jgi:hypothetical protein
MKYAPRTLIVLVCLGALGIALPALAFKSHQASQLGGLTDSELKQVVVRLERTGCYGDCPSYKLIIHGDGRVEYVGDQNVKLTGQQESRIELADIKRIVSEFEKANYFSIDQYTEKSCSCTLCTDMPTTTTEIQVKGSSHQVEHYHGCTCAPKGLWVLEKAIDDLVHTEQWTGDVSKQGPRGTTCFRK